MPVWLIGAMAYALIVGVVTYAFIGWGNVRCSNGYCDWECGHRWRDLVAGVLWPIGIPLIIGIAIARLLRLGTTREQRCEDKQERDLEVQRKREELANARRKAAEAESAALTAEIEATNLTLSKLDVNLEPLRTY